MSASETFKSAPNLTIPGPFGSSAATKVLDNEFNAKLISLRELFGGILGALDGFRESASIALEHHESALIQGFRERLEEIGKQ